MTSHAFLDHTGETVLLVRAPGLDQLFAEAARALGELEREGIPTVGQAVARPLTLEAPDFPALLVDWLNELIYLAETEAAVPVTATVHLAEPASLDAEVGLARLARRPALVKAATHHRLRLEQGPAGWVAEVILDV